ncbi:type VI secretion system-associated protein (plasmid) [Paraburkholderia sp. PGU19]|uniref:type VI secretion system baseplate subunit TssK n=1 Tax=Paraburkholderia sp. PGU19 TaxID=2735434 RepID=UPI0015DB049C|nr:type VI secretion system baseplate subunit TssK [Paraburkholderia sp. PGU19]BCG04508.1 type VI secretion system-associated protein [Paraburkholderia sp. PGU19]
MSHPVSPVRASAALRHRVVWSEGMFLRPQHFQQLERHFERYVQLRCLPVQGLFWGFTRLEIDQEALEQGKVVLLCASGIMPDGTPFDFAGGKDGPAPLDIRSDLSNATIVLAVPTWRGDGVQVSFDDDAASPLSRYVAEETEVEDVNAIGLGPALIQVGKLHLRLMPESKLSSDWQAMGVIRIVERRADRRVIVDDSYIPPILAAQASPVLASQMNELHRLLMQRGETLASRLAQPGRAGVGEVADFLLLELINRYIAVSWHALQPLAIHPEALYRDWLKLACDLSTFTSGTHSPQALPPYQHDDLSETFGTLMNELRRSLATMLEQNAVEIAFRDAGNGVRVAIMSDTELMREAGFVLAVHADVPAEALHTRFPAQVKLGPVERIRDLVQLQLPGIGVRALPVAPRQIPYHAGHAYFELDKSSELWRQLDKSGGLALYLAGEFPGLSLAFWAIRG